MSGHALTHAMQPTHASAMNCGICGESDEKSRVAAVPGGMMIVPVRRRRQSAVGCASGNPAQSCSELCDVVADVETGSARRTRQPSVGSCRCLLQLSRLACLLRRAARSGPVTSMSRSYAAANQIHVCVDHCIAALSDWLANAGLTAAIRSSSDRPWAATNGATRRNTPTRAAPCMRLASSGEGA